MQSTLEMEKVSLLVSQALNVERLGD